MLAQSLLTNKFGIKGVIGSYEKYITCIPELALSNGNSTVKETLPSFLTGVFMKESLACTSTTANCEFVGADFVFIGETGILHRFN